MNVVQTAKDHPLKTALGMSGSIIAIVVALFSIDARYAHASDLEQTKIETQQVIRDTARILRKQSIEDKLFEYDVRQAEAEAVGKRLSPVDTAVQQRYKRQLDELKSGRVQE
jgi:hypothetical protein